MVGAKGFDPLSPTPRIVLPERVSRMLTAVAQAASRPRQEVGFRCSPVYLFGPARPRALSHLGWGQVTLFRRDNSTLFVNRQDG